MLSSVGLVKNESISVSLIPDLVEGRMEGGCQSVRDSQDYPMSAHLPEGGFGFSSAEHSELKRLLSLRNTADVEQEACVWMLSGQTEASFTSYHLRIGRALC